MAKFLDVASSRTFGTALWGFLRRNTVARQLNAQGEEWITLRDEDFVGGVVQLKAGTRYVKVLIADTANIDVSGTPDNKVILKLPMIRAAEWGRKITVEVLKDCDVALRILGYTVSQGVGHGILKQSFNTGTRGDLITVRANRDLTWDVVEVRNALRTNHAPAGTLAALAVDHTEVYAGTTRVDDDANDGEPKLQPLLFPGETVQLTARSVDASDNVLNGTPLSFLLDSGPFDPENNLGVRVTSDGLLTGSAPVVQTGGNAQITVSGDGEGVAVQVTSLCALAASVLAAARLIRAHGVRLRAYDTEGGTLLADTGVLPHATDHGDETLSAVLYPGYLSSDPTALGVLSAVNSGTDGTIGWLRVTDGSGALDVGKVVTPGVVLSSATFISLQAELADVDGSVAVSAVLVSAS